MSDLRAHKRELRNLVNLIGYEGVETMLNQSRHDMRLAYKAFYEIKKAHSLAIRQPPSLRVVSDGESAIS